MRSEYEQWREDELVAMWLTCNLLNLHPKDLGSWVWEWSNRAKSRFQAMNLVSCDNLTYRIAMEDTEKPCPGDAKCLDI